MMSETSQPHVLIVDDDPRICRMLQRYLQQEGYRVSCAANGKAMRECLSQDPPQLVLLDLVLPGESGLTLAAELRQQRQLGVIIVSGKGESVDRIVGLEIGADDYVSKPFDQRELLARIRSVLRRLGQQPAQAASGRVLRFLDWRMDLDGRELRIDGGEEIHLSSLEFELLALLLSHPQRVFSRDELMEDVCCREWSPADRSIDVLVSKLRHKLGEHDPDTDYIKGVRNAGYKFVVPVYYE